MKPTRMHEPPQDIPFYPDWLNRELPAAHRESWCIAPRLTDRLRAKGYTLAITPKRNKEMQAAHAAEVRAAVRLRLIERAGQTPLLASSAEIVDAILADPAIAILVDHYERRPKP